MRTSTSSVCGLAQGTTIAIVSQPIAPLPCETFISRGMVLLIGCACGALWCLLCDLPAASLADNARLYCGY